MCVLHMQNIGQSMDLWDGMINFRFSSRQIDTMPVGAIKVAVPRCLVSVEFAKKSGAGMGLQMEWLLVMMLCAALGTPVAGELLERYHWD